MVNLYHDVSLPEEFESEEFLQNAHRCVMPGGLFVFNKVAATRNLFVQFQALKKKIDERFGNVRIIKALGINR